MVVRHDFAFPFRIDPGSREAQRTGYERHVADLVYQLLMTAPGERVNLPDFGCGLRTLIFAPNSETLAATTQMLVRQALTRWLSEHLNVLGVEVTQHESEIVVQVKYELVSTRTSDSVEVRVS